jgi:hypothetical protein
MISVLPGLGLQLLAAVVLLWRLCSFGDDGVCIWDRHRTQNVLLTIDGRAPLASIDVAFLCATLDWWPPDKCDYGTCSWGNDSMLNLVFYNWPVCLCVCVCVCMRVLRIILVNWRWKLICSSFLLVYSFDKCSTFANIGLRNLVDMWESNLKRANKDLCSINISNNISNWLCRILETLC